VQKITSDAPNEIFPDLSPDGEWLAYVSDNFLDKSQPRQVRLRRLSSGQERVPRPSTNTQGGVAFSRDGKRLAFSEFGKPDVAIFTAPVEGGEPQKACEDCGRVLDWSPDGRRVLYEAGAGVAYLGVVDVATGQKSSLVTHPENSVRNGKFSGDGRWVTFNVESGRETSRVYVASAEREAPPSEWAPVTEGIGVSAGAAFAADCKSIFYAEFGAPNGTVYRRPFDTRSGRPTGPRSVVHAFNSPRLGFARLTPWHIGMDVHPQRIILSLEQQSSEIYLAELPRSR
jgi:Tol biopolymer transport system component